MLGKRFRRTTSVSQLRVISPAVGAGGDGGPDKAVRTAPCKAARPSTLEAHGSAGNGDGAEARRSDEESSLSCDCSIEQGTGAIAKEAPAAHGALMADRIGGRPVDGIHGRQGNAMREQNSAVAFLDACFYCRRRLKLERDIFMYRGDTAFCSEECRFRQMANDEQRFAIATSNQRGSREGARARPEASVAA